MMVQGFCKSLDTSAGKANQLIKSQGFPCIKRQKHQIALPVQKQLN